MHFNLSVEKSEKEHFLNQNLYQNNSQDYLQKGVENPLIEPNIYKPTPNEKQNFQKDSNEGLNMNQYLFIQECQPSKNNDNKISISYDSRCQQIITIIIIFIFQFFSFIFARSFYIIIASVNFIIEIFLIFYLENKNLEIIKDDLNQTVKIRIINYLCYPKKKYEFPLKNINFQIQLYTKNYRISLII